MYVASFLSFPLSVVVTHIVRLGERKEDDTSDFRKFKRELLHASLSYILMPLKPGMESPEILRFPDGYFRRVIFSLGPYIADYPEQVLLACIVNGWCAR